MRNQSVTPVSQVSAGPGVAPWGDGVRVMGGLRNMDPVSDQTNVMPILLFKAGSYAACFALAIITLLNSVTNWGQAAVNAAAIVIAAALSSFVVWLRLRADQKKEDRLEDRTDAQVLVDRERLADERLKSLITEMEKFHSERVKGLESSVNIAKELFEQQKDVCNQQRELITQQASTIEDLRKRPA